MIKGGVFQLGTRLLLVQSSNRLLTLLSRHVESDQIASDVGIDHFLLQV